MNESVKDIFSRALEKDSPAARAQYLEEVCADDHALRQEVESLLAAYFQANGFLPHPMAAGAAQKTLLIPHLSETTGVRIGHYKLLEQIGAGGFGVVWMAEQEEPVRRRVALKIIKLGMDTKEVVARFEAERQALAMMDHPNIASVFDGGATDTGRPYFVMELVKGVPITDYCDANQLPMQERLELFMQVCHAVQHAHQKGVIHRDLKPSNILVTVKDDRPVPKVIDFGVAKATQARLTEKTLFTQFRQWIGTPAYMSPEQAGLGSLDVDTRSDIYSLGVLLYELLTGRTPFDTQKLMERGCDAVMRTIREEDPPKPSTRLSTLDKEALDAVAAKRHADPAKLNRLVHGDLDWIVMKTLEKDRKRRYETPGALSGDIERFLRCETVSAAAPTLRYRLAKFGRRNRASLATAAAIVGLMLGGTAVSIWQAARASKFAREELHQRLLAQKLASQSQANLEMAQDNLYAADMALAGRAVEEGDLERARQFLDSHRPKPGEPDRRGIEWRYLWKLSGGEQIGQISMPTNLSRWVDALAISPDGQWVAAGGADGRISLYSTRDFKPLRVFLAHPRKCTDIVFAPGGRTLVSCSWEENQVRFWAVDSGSLLSEAAIPHPFRLAFSPGGALLAVTSEKGETGETFLCDGVSGQRVAELAGTGHRAVAFSRDGQTLATGVAQNQVKVWDVPSRQLVRSFRIAQCSTLAFSPDLSVVAGTRWSDLSLWKVSDGTYVGSLTNGPWNVRRIVFSPDGRRVACGNASVGRVGLWDLETRKPLGYLRGHQAAIVGLVFTPDSRFILSGAGDGTIRLWHADGTRACSSFVRMWAERAWNMPQWPFASDGRHFAARSGRTIYILDTLRGRREAVLPTASYPMGFLPGSNVLVALNGAWVLESKNLLNPVRQGLPAGYKSMATLELWDWSTLTARKVSLSHLPVGNCVASAFSPKGDYAAFNLPSSGQGGKRQEIVLVDVTTGEARPQTFLTDGPGEGLLEFSPDGQRLFINGGNRDWIWDWQTTNAPLALPAQHPGIRRFAHARNASRLAICQYPEGVTVWDSSSPSLIDTLPRSFTDSWYLSFSADGNTLAVGHGLGGNSKFWHVPTHRELLTFPNGRAICFSPNEEVLAVVAIEGVHFTSLPTLAEIDAGLTNAPFHLSSIALKELEAIVAPARVTVAVLQCNPLDDATFAPEQRHWLGTFEGMVRNQLRGCNQLRVLTEEVTQREDARLKQSGPTNLNPVTGFTMLNERLRSDWAIQSLLDRRDTVWTLKMRMIGVTGKESKNVLSASGTNLCELQEKAVRHVLGELQITPTPQEEALIGQRMTKSDAALELFSRALDDETSNLQSVDLCREALEADPDFAEARGWLAGLLYNRGSNEEALREARRALAQNPGNHLAGKLHQLMAAILARSGQVNEAEQEVAKGLRAEPDETWPLVLRAELRMNIQDVEGAGAALRAALELDPRNAEIHARLAQVHLKQGRLTNALHHLACAEGLNAEAPKRVDLDDEWMLAEAYQKAGNVAKALEHYHRMLKEAEKEQTPEERLATIRAEVKGLETRAQPASVNAKPPMDYTAGELQAALRARLTDEELARAVNPLESTPEMEAWARQIAAGTGDELPRARKLFDTLSARPHAAKGGSRTASEVFKLWKDPDQSFWCQEYAKLFVALARSAGIQAYYVHVDKDYAGTVVDHDCAIVFAEGKAWLVDPAYGWFGVPHQEFRVLDDLQTIAHHAFQPHDQEVRVDLCRAGLKLDPEFTWGRWNLVAALLKLGQLEEARRELDAAKRQAPEGWQGCRLEGLLALKNDQSDSARKWLRKAVELNPADGDTQILLGEALFRTGQQAEARQAFLSGLRRQVFSKSNEALARERLKLIELTLGAATNAPTAAHVEMDANSYRDLGTSLLFGPNRNYAEAAKWLRKAADMGDAHSLCLLGLLHRDGLGVPKNPAKSVRLFRTAAEAGNADGMRLLFVVYSMGQGVEKNFDEAIRWGRRSAEAGDSLARMLLGRALYEGKMVSKNMAEAMFWLTLAAEAEETTPSTDIRGSDPVNVSKQSARLLREVKLFATEEEQQEARAKLENFRAGKKSPARTVGDAPSTK